MRSRIRPSRLALVFVALLIALLPAIANAQAIVKVNDNVNFRLGILLLGWVYINSVEFFTHKWDLYPFILLNLVLSFQATYAGPIVLLAGNRHAQKDRLTLEHAADEADKGEEHITRILIEIKKNTDLTLRILKELEAESADVN